MCQEKPALPVRDPHDPAMAATVRLWQANRTWVTDDPAVLRRVAQGLRVLPGNRPTTQCGSEEPIRGYAHAHQVMSVHAGHRCRRYTEAAAYAVRVRW